jgi:[ribosomal protein S5]-alanine N-acetyltransferase
VIVLETARLHIRGLEFSDLEPFFAVCGNSQAMRWMGDRQPLSLSDTRRWITVSQDNYAQHQRGCMAVCEKDSQQLIGFCGLVRGFENQIELIYAFLPNVWGRGYATEAASAMLGYSHSILPCVLATIYPENTASQRVLEKLGFVYSHTLQNDDQTQTAFFVYSPIQKGTPAEHQNPAHLGEANLATTPQLIS